MSDWSEMEKRDKRTKRLRELPAFRVQAMNPKSSFRVIVQPIASSLTPVGRTRNSSVGHPHKWCVSALKWGKNVKEVLDILRSPA